MARPAWGVPWARILIEGAVIVFSILIAFGIDAWWGARQERVREQAYLNLLTSDLRSTLANNDRFGAIAISRLEPATARLVRAYYEPGPVSADSIASWLDAAVRHTVVQPRLGTAESLVSSGDLSLIRRDSLRVAIRDYLTEMRFFDSALRRGADSHNSAVVELSRLVDLPAIRLSLTPSAVRDSLAATDTFFPFPSGPVRVTSSVDLEHVVRDPEVHAILYRLLQAKGAISSWRRLMRQRSEQLLNDVEAALEE